MSEIEQQLTDIDAPEDVVAWAAAHDALEDAWEACARPDYRAWLVAIAGAPMETLIEASAAALFSVSEGREHFDVLVSAIEDAIAEDDGAACVRLAKKCEDLAERGPTSYRSAPSGGYVAVARAAALVCRAREALLAAELSLEASRLDRARVSSSLMGGGIHAFLPADPGPVRLTAVHPTHAARGMLLFVVAACAEALRELTTALREWRRDGDVEAELDAVVWQVLVPEEDESA